MEETGFTLEGRVLCSDEACVGTIGPDGRCKLCGRPYEGDDPIAGDAAPPTAGGDAGAQQTQADGAPAPEPPDGDSGAASERVCCPDEACVGIIGPNGACGVCGKKIR